MAFHLSEWVSGPMHDTPFSVSGRYFPAIGWIVLELATRAGAVCISSLKGAAMNCRSCAPVSAVLALCAVLSNAADKDFWCSKPYTEWNEKEVQKLLKDSPWSRPI